MRVISKRPLRGFWSRYPDSEAALKLWHKLAEAGEWRSFAELKRTFPSADQVGNDRVVFNIRGNKYWLIALVLFEPGNIYVRFIGTHKEYEKVNARNV